MLNWQRRNSFRIGKYISWKLVIVSYLSKYSFFFSKIKHKLVFSFLTPQLSEIIEKYKKIKEEPWVAPPQRNIWVLWWQGIENAPPIVKTCIDRIAKNEGTNLMVLTKDNINDYITLPDYVLEKKEKDVISFAYVADVIRMMLLEKYGGLWIDSTVFLSGKIPEKAFSVPFYSMHNPYDAKTKYISHNLWHVFVLGSKPNGKLVSFMKEALCEYVKNNECLPDYLTIDYMIMLAYMNFPDVKEEIDSLDFTSDNTYALLNKINKPFNQKQYEKMLDGVIYSKMVWNKKFKLESHGKPTYYSALFNSSKKY